MHVGVLPRNFEPQRLLRQAVADYGAVHVGSRKQCLLAPALQELLVDIGRVVEPLPVELQRAQRGDGNADRGSERAACRTCPAPRIV